MVWEEASEVEVRWRRRCRKRKRRRGRMRREVNSSALMRGNDESSAWWHRSRRCHLPSTELSTQVQECNEVSTLELPFSRHMIVMFSCIVYARYR